MSRRDVNKVMLILSFVFALGIIAGRAADASEWTASPMVIPFSHLSDIAYGCPLRCDDPSGEPTEDFVAPLGITFFSPSGRWQIDFAHGWKCRDCDLRQGMHWESGTEFRVRWYPLGVRRWRIGR